MTDQHTPDPRDRYVGSLLGLALGDALVSNRDRPDAGTRQRKLDVTGVEIPSAGIQYGPDTELAFCLAETLITSNGFVDPALAGARFLGVLRTPEGEALSETTRSALTLADETDDFQAGIGGVQEAGPAVRAIPVALAHALSESNPDLVVREVMRAVLITHADPDVVNGALAVAQALRLVVRREVPVEMVLGEVLAFIDEDEVARQLRLARRVLDGERDDPGDQRMLEHFAEGSDVARSVAAGLYLFGRYFADVERLLRAIDELDGLSPISGAIAGALAGAHVGGSRIPPDLVDSLEGRMYVLMAAPALLRTAQRRAGLFFHLYQQ